MLFRSDPSTTAEGDFRVRSTISLFDPGRRRREAYGIFFGGRDLQGPNQSHTYFLIRDTGDFLVKRRVGSATETVRQWSPSSAIVQYRGDDEAKNVLTIEAKGGSVDFVINGERVTSVPRRDVRVDGVVGLRVNHGLNLHISDLVVEPLGGAEDR